MSTSVEPQSATTSATTSRIQKVAVIGFGAMGSGIAQVCAAAGCQVVAIEPSDEVRARNEKSMHAFLNKAIEKGKLTEELRDGLLERLTFGDRSAAYDADLVIEAIPELIELKRELFADLDANCRPDTIIASNTSSLSVTSMAAATKRPERVVGLHFFNPVPVLPLVEVVTAERTSDEVAQAAYDFVLQIGKKPIRCGDTPGFVVNRILIPLINDVVRLYENGLASAEDIDSGMKYGANWPIGPLALADLVGIDVLVHAAEGMYDSLREPRLAPPALLQRMVEAGKLGRKTGEGFYSYTS